MAFKLYLKITKNLPRIFLYYPKNLASVICPITFEYGEKHPQLETTNSSPRKIHHNACISNALLELLKT